MGLEAGGRCSGGLRCGWVQRPMTSGSMCGRIPETSAGSGSLPRTQGGLYLLKSTIGTTGCLDSSPGSDSHPTTPEAPSYLWGQVPDAAFPHQAAATGLLGWSFLEKVRDLLNQEIAVFQVGKQEGHLVLGANRQRAGQDTGAICFFDNGHLRRQKHWVSVSRDVKLEGSMLGRPQQPQAALLQARCSEWTGTWGHCIHMLTLPLVAISELCV